jgi:hypothetical protein
MLKEILVFTGHPLISSRHQRTFEVTKSSELTARGDCIVGVNASKAGVDFDPIFRRMLADENTIVTITIKVGVDEVIINAMGHPDLTLSDPEELVIRKSSFISPRTLAVQADKSAADIPRRIVSNLRERGATGSMEIVLKRV